MREATVSYKHAKLVAGAMSIAKQSDRASYYGIVCVLNFVNHTLNEPSMEEGTEL